MTAADWIAERRRFEQAAPPLPYRYREGAEGDPSNGPTFTALEAEHPDLGWSEIARGDYDSWSGIGLQHAAEACSALPRALDAIEAVLAIAHDLANQPTDWDEDTEAEIRAGRRIITAIEQALAS